MKRAGSTLFFAAANAHSHTCVCEGPGSTRPFGQGLGSIDGVSTRGDQEKIWQHVGPRNIFDDANGNGEAGTLQDAAATTGLKIMYAGGLNNGASSGVLKTTDLGKTWLRKSKGLFDTRITALQLHPASQEDGMRVFAGTPSGLYLRFYYI